MSEGKATTTKVQFIGIERIEHEVVPMGRTGFKPSDELAISFLVRSRDQEIVIPITMTDGYFDAARLVPIARHKLHEVAVALAEATKHWSLPEDQMQPDYPKGGGKAG